MANQVAVAINIGEYSILDIVELSLCLQRAQELEKLLLKDIAQKLAKSEQERKETISHFTTLIEKLEDLQASDDGLLERMHDLGRFVNDVRVCTSC